MCRSKLAEVLEKVLKAELIRMGLISNVCQTQSQP
jgi:hypothetical protein